MKTIAVIFGGKSAEHDVSIVTAISSIIVPLQLTKQYNVHAIYIAKDGNWYSHEKLKNISLYQSGEIEQFLKKESPVLVSIGDGFAITKPGQFAGRKQRIAFDLVFPAMHGTHGEDGELMGVLEMANVAYVGCGVAASAVAMDKVLSKQVTTSAGIPTTPWVWATASEFTQQPQQVIERCEGLRYPLFVKPAHLGSSIGITRVTDQSQLASAIEVAAHYDDKIIIEQGVQNLIEVTLPVIGNETPVPAYLEQPSIKSEDFFDFETKYMQGGKGGKKGGKQSGAQGYSTIPAKLSDELYKKAESLGLLVYKTVGCSGIARVDMLIDSKTNEVYFNEINPLPGGLYAHNWQAKGVSKIQLVQQLVKYAEERFAAKNKVHTSFSTNYLKQF